MNKYRYLVWVLHLDTCFLHDVELWNDAREPGSGWNLGVKLWNGARERAWLHVVGK